MIYKVTHGTQQQQQQQGAVNISTMYASKVGAGAGVCVGNFECKVSIQCGGSNSSSSSNSDSNSSIFHLFMVCYNEGPSQPIVNSGTPNPRPSIVTHCATNPSQGQQTTCRHTRLQQKTCNMYKAQSEQSAAYW
jgi:hypothetical protein